MRQLHLFIHPLPPIGRQEVIHEIITTEGTYVRDLNIISSVFVGGISGFSQPTSDSLR